ncbi:MAG: MFS transporter [Aliidongia sp.]
MSAAEKGLMVAVPVLAGAGIRIVNGILVDHLKPRLTGIISQVAVILGLTAAWYFGVHSFAQTLLVGIVLGIAGASFAVALPLASRWYPPEHQGTALGIAGAGNSGTVLAALFAPGLAAAFGWNNVLGLVVLPLIATLAIYAALAKDSPECPAPKSLPEYLKVLKIGDAWWFMFFYSVTFGGFVGLASSLTIYFNDQYGLNPVHAGYFTAACVFAGSLVRPIGGAVADRIGGVRTLTTVYMVAATALILASFGLSESRMAARRLRRRDAGARHGQWRRVPARAAALPRRNRRHDRPGRHDGRGRRLLPRLQPGLFQAADRQLSGRAAGLRHAGAGGAGRAERREAPVARDLGRGTRRRPNLRGCGMNMLSPTPRRLVVIGNGMAGMRTVEELLKRAPGLWDITVFGAEPHVNYDRILLSSVLAGEKDLGAIEINSRAWYAENRIRLFTGDPVAAIDRDARTVTSQSGQVEPYDALLLATGSRPIVPPIPGLELPGTCAFRDIADIETMIAASEQHRRAIVIGGGLLGLEAANGLAKRGMSVAVVHLMDTLMERQLDAEAGKLLQAALDERGISFFMNGQTEEIFGDGRVEGIRLADGREVPSDLVVFAIGIRPNTDLARAAGLDINRGIRVGDDMRTSDPAIFAVGECVEHRGKTYGLVAPLWDMAKVCADHLAGDAETVSDYNGTVLATRLKVTGIDLFSAGDFQGDESTDEVLFRDPARNIYKKLVLRDDKLVGAVLYGDVRDGGWYFQLLREAAPLGELRDTVIFGQGFAGAAADAGAAIAALPDSAEICGCNGVCKGTITAAIAGQGLTTLDAVRAHTKASSSCGSCTPQVEQLLVLALGTTTPSRPARSRCANAQRSGTTPSGARSWRSA